MGFDCKKFNKTRFSRRAEMVEVPELAAFFDENEKPEIEVRQLGAAEFGHALEEVKRNKLDVIRALAEASGSGDREAILAAVSSYFSDDGDRLPDDVILRMYLIEYATDLDHGAVVKLKDDHAEVFYRLSNRVKKLTGQAPTMGESRPSGATGGSKRQPNSAPDEAPTLA